jgi:hypothetical protein
MARLEKILDKADELGMVAIVGFFYFGQDQRVKDEEAVRRAVLNATNWILDKGYRNVLVEVNNECNISYDHEILKPRRITELIALVQRQERNGRRLLVSTSFGGTTSGGERDNPDNANHRGRGQAIRFRSDPRQRPERSRSDQAVHRRDSRPARLPHDAGAGERGRADFKGQRMNQEML